MLFKNIRRYLEGACMNIMFVSSSMEDGGAQRVISVLANAYAGQNKQVEIISIEGGEPEYGLDANVVYLPFPGRRESGKIKRMKAREAFIKACIKEYNPDIVISFCTEPNIYTIAAARTCDIPVIVSERNDPERDPRSKFARTLRKLLYPFADGFVFQTNQAANYFTKGIKSRSVVISNPVKQNLPEVYRGEHRKAVVTAARLEPQKNIDLLLISFAEISNKYPDYCLEIYGRGDEEQRLVELAQSLGIQDCVKFKGFSLHLHEEIRDAACFVLSSDYEGMPNALIEAMALGLPVISTDCPCGGPAMLIQNGTNGLLVPVGDADKMSAAMIKIIESEELSTLLGRNAEEIREDLAPLVISERWMDYISDVIRKKRA